MVDDFRGHDDGNMDGPFEQRSKCGTTTHRESAKVFYIEVTDMFSDSRVVRCCWSSNTITGWREWATATSYIYDHDTGRSPFKVIFARKKYLVQQKHIDIFNMTD
jgi:hypothetical protein